jgi:hypothetical protein
MEQLQPCLFDANGISSANGSLKQPNREIENVVRRPSSCFTVTRAVDARIQLGLPCSMRGVTFW